MWSRLLKVCLMHCLPWLDCSWLIIEIVIARNALAQEESEEFSGDFSDPIDIHLDKERDGCAC